MSRRSQLIQAFKRNQTKQTKPYIIVIPAYVGPAGHEPGVTWLKDRREPTQVELIEAIVAAGFTRDVAVTAAAKALKQSTLKPPTT